MMLRAARERSGKTQAQVAKETGVSQLSYQRYEYNTREPSVQTAIRIARVLDSTVEELFGAATPGNSKKAWREPGEVVQEKNTTSRFAGQEKLVEWVRNNKPV